jgi:hypothetical protein
MSGITILHTTFCIHCTTLVGFAHDEAPTVTDTAGKPDKGSDGRPFAGCPQAVYNVQHILHQEGLLWAS